MKNKSYDIHHLIPRSRRADGFDISHELNLKRLQIKVHQRIHALFDNMTPQEQLEFWFELNKVILSRDCREQIGSLILDVKERFYREEVLSGEPVLHREWLPRFED